MEFLGIVGLLVVVVGLLTALFRANEVFCASFRRGRMLVVRGSLSSPLLKAFRDALVGGGVDHTLVKGFTDGGEIRLVVAGTDEELAQRLRTVFSLFPASNLPLRSQTSKRTWWQLVGFVWLAWWMEARNQDDSPTDVPKRSNIVKFRK